MLELMHRNNFLRPHEKGETLLLQFQFSVCACIRPDLSKPKLVYLCMDFKIIWHSCSP